MLAIPELGQTVIVGLVALVFSTAAAATMLPVLQRLNSRQKISQYVPEHSEKEGTPTMGGLIILVGCIAGFVAMGEQSWPLLALLFGFGVIGFIDDYVLPRMKEESRGLSWIPKLILQFGVAWVALVIAGFSGWGLAAAGFLIVAFCNAYNFADGLDGLAGGLMLILAKGLAVVALLTGLFVEIGPIVFILGLTMLPFLWLNAPPAKVFMGDVGALPLGALLGYVFLMIGIGTAGQGGVLLALFVLAGVLIAEILPVPLQILSVKLRKGKRLFPRTPIHHAFQHAGMPETRIVWRFLIVQVVLVLLAVGIIAGMQQ